MDAVVRATITGLCTHNSYPRLSGNENKAVKTRSLRKHLLSSTARTEAASHINNNRGSSTPTYFNSLPEMSEIELEAVNITACQTPKLLRQATVEYRNKEQLCYVKIRNTLVSFRLM